MSADAPASEGAVERHPANEHHASPNNDEGENPAAEPVTRPVRLGPTLSPKSEAYDPAGIAYGQLQAPRAAMSGFAADSLDNIDWVATLRLGLIEPRAELRRQGTMRLREDEILMRNTREMPWVLFPHRAHTEWLACSNCHPKPFVDRRAANTVTMDSIMRGEHCGMCHDRVAFSIFACERCHSVPHDGSPPAWW